MRRLLPLTLVLAVAAPAVAFQGKETRRGNLDRDRAVEVVRSERVDIKGVANEFDRTKITVSDTCRGRKVRRRIAGPQDNLVFIRLKRADTRPGREVFVDMRSGAASRQGEVRVMAWRRCKPRGLFVYRTTKPTRAPKGSNGEVGSFTAKLRDVTKRYRGLEVALDERFLDKNDPECCGSFQKVSYWRYDRGRDRYVAYRSVVKRVKFGSTP